MANLETRATLGTRHDTKTNEEAKKHSTENAKDEKHGHHRKTGNIMRCSLRVRSSSFL
jgi:hypothetical protein